MAVEASISKFKKNNLKIYAVACILFAIVFAYDGYLSKYQWSHRRSFYEEHVKDSKPDDTMMFNKTAPIFLAALAAVFMWRCWAIKDKKLWVDESELIINEKEKISLGSIQKIDKTHFQSKGFFVITYKNENGNETNRKLSNRTYDNLEAILDKLVAKIS